MPWAYFEPVAAMPSLFSLDMLLVTLLLGVLSLQPAITTIIKQTAKMFIIFFILLSISFPGFISVKPYIQNPYSIFLLIMKP
jgi:hypothetical protein